MRTLPFIMMTLLGLTMSASAEVKTRTIEYKQGDTVLVGYLAWKTDSWEAKAPAVVVCPEWWGNDGYAHKRAEMLAAEGYVALAIDMYGKGDDGKAKTTQDPAQAGKWAGEVNKDPALLRARARAGYDLLASQANVDPKRIAAIGYCMGGTVALELARTGADLRAVVAFHASRIAAADPADNKRITGTVLICHGQDDGFCAPEEIARFHAQMKEAGVDYEFDSYAGAVHSFTNPGADKHGMPGVAYNEKADRRSWARMEGLFREVFE